MIVDSIKNLNILRLGNSNRNDNRQQMDLSVTCLSQNKGSNRDVFQPSFGGSIPHKDLISVGKVFLKRVFGAETEEHIYKLAKSYYYDNVVPLITHNSFDLEDSEKTLKLFRHELVNSISAPLEINLNPEYKFMNEQITCFSNKQYVEHQKGSFKDIVSKVNEMALYWTRLEDWHDNKKAPVLFKQVTNQLKMAVDLANNSGAKVLFNDNIVPSKMSTHAFDLYNMLSQVVLNAVKYSDGKPVMVEFSNVDEKAGKYLLTVINKGTRPIPDRDIDKIILGNGYRGNSGVVGTGTGYKEIISILRKYHHDKDILGIIEKGRKEGVKVTIPFTLEEKM